jgi:selenide,water dikinase
MQGTVDLHRDLVLVGGGHSHALTLRMLAMRPLDGLRITLVSPHSHTPYSGMLPGLIAGHYSFEQTHIDLSLLCQWAGVRFIAAEVTALDPQTRTLSMAGRPPLRYDLLSIDIGSQPELDSVPGAREQAVPVKPVSGLWQRWQGLDKALAVETASQTIALVGGGAGSVELALAMAHRLSGRAAPISLWCGAPEILQGYNARARSAVMAALHQAEITVYLNSRVERVEPGRLHIEGGAEERFDHLFWCTGATPAPWIEASGLATDEAGFLAVSDTLQSLDDERVFGAGDIATQVKHPRPKAGVYAVRQAPVLAHNLRSVLLGKKLRQHHPQDRFLSLISLGTRRASADKGLFSATGAWVWRWKDRIDRQFMEKFDDLPASMPLRPWGRLPELAGETQLPCGGCGAKVGADTLSDVLAELSLDFPGHSSGGGDDSAPIPAQGHIVQSLDILREIVPDPWLMGRIAANHALSDLYACGARPVSALAAVTLPFSGAGILHRDLKQILAGALQEFRAVDCQLTGGHSMQGPELAVGFAVNGVAVGSADELLGKRGLQEGDKLVLTKPLGTGALFAAHMQLAADGRHIKIAVDSMLLSNNRAGELALAHNATACTDITGFGLLGHLLEMLGREWGARVHLDSVPLLEGAVDAVSGGIVSSSQEANEAALNRAQVECGRDARVRLMCDPQTSGGLLIGLAAHVADDLCRTLVEEGHSAAVIGEIIPVSSGGRIVLF